MDSFEELSSQELLEAQSHLWNHIFSFVNSMSLKCALELGIPDAIHKHGKPITLFDLATSLSIPPSKIPCFGRLMRSLAHSGIFSLDRKENEDDLYSLTTVSKILVQEETSTCQSPLVFLVLDQLMLSTWNFLGAFLTEHEPCSSSAFEIAHNVSFYEATAKFPELNRVMNEAMACDAGFVTKEIVMRDCSEVFDDQGLRSLVDVGGGTGTMARGVAKAFPHVKCTVFDLPHVVADLEETNAVRVVGGDMFKFIPSAQATLFKRVLPDWSDEECVAILKRCKETTPCKEEGGKVIIIDMVLETGINIQKEHTETQLLYDVRLHHGLYSWEAKK